MNPRTGGGVFVRGGWPFAVLVVVMLLPAAFALWFMNEAITTQASAARQRVLEAYRGQLRLVRSRIDANWRAAMDAAI